MTGQAGVVRLALADPGRIPGNRRKPIWMDRWQAGKRVAKGFLDPAYRNGGRAFYFPDDGQRIATKGERTVNENNATSR